LSDISHGPAKVDAVQKLYYLRVMHVLERISGTRVRHDWRRISRAVAGGKSFLVENHGRPEALISPPPNVRRQKKFDSRSYFSALKKSPLVRLASVEVVRASET
jgi:hypothetical protein